jgi:AcrR family transcriptional regulator
MAKVGAVLRRGETEPRRDQVLRAAEALFARYGYRGVGLREIAAQVGIRAPSLFKHFPSKKALYNAVLLSIFARLTEVTRRLEGARDHEDRLRDFLFAYADLLAADPHLAPLLFRELMERPEAMEPPTRSKAFAIYRRLDAFLRDAARARRFRDVDRFNFQIALTGAILYYGIAARPYQAALHETLSAPDLEAWKTTLLEIARGSLVARAGRPRTGTGSARRRRTDRLG